MIPQKIRILGIDDIYIIYLMGNGLYIGEIAKILTLDYTTVRRRIQNIEYAFGTMLEKKGAKKKRVLTEIGQEIVEVCTTFINEFVKYTDA